MKEITLTINGQEVEGREGDTVLEICQANGIDVPTLCHFDGLSDVGACRMCVVEIERERRPVPSCTYPARNGLVVKTHTEQLERYRRLLLELMLSEHNHDCSVCDSDGRCELQNLINRYGIDKTRFPISELVEPIDDSSEVISRDPNKCILCGRCVRACAEISMHRILDFASRGDKTVVAADMNELLAETGCMSCGACVQVCPTGALSPKSARFQGKDKEFRKVRTTCSGCGNGCQIELNIKDNRIVKVYGVADGPENEGHLCIKGRFGWDYVYHADRLTTPLIKRNGTFEEAGWDEALDLVASRFKELKDKYGSDALAGIASAKCTNEENYLFQKFIRTCFGTNSVDFCTRLCHTTSAVALTRAFGSGAMTNSIRESEKSDVVLIAGFNPTETSPVLGDHLKHLLKSNGLKLIVVDPRATEITEYSEIWLRPRIGTDAAWVNGMINVIINEDLYDHEFVESRTEGFDEFRKPISEYTPERVEEITGVPKEKIIAAARLYAQADRASIMFSMGVTQHIYGTDNVAALCNLAMLTGNVGRAGTGVNTIAKQNNGQGAGDMGCLVNIYPGGQSVTDPKINEKFEKAWGVELSSKIGLTESEMICDKGRIKGLYVMGGNPMLSGPNLSKVREVLENLDFMVVQDIFLTETAELADVVLPGVSFVEKDGTFTNVGRRVQRVRKAIPEIGQSRQEWEIISDISQRMGYPMSYHSPEGIMEEIASLTPPYGGIHYDRLDGPGLQWPCPNRDHQGTPYLHKDKFSRGKGLFTPVEYHPPAESPDEEYPFLLTTGKNLYHLHTGAITRRSVPLNNLSREDLLEMNPLDAEKLEIRGTTWVRVSSRRGQITLKLNTTRRVPEGTVFATFHSGQPAVNTLTNDVWDPLGKVPELKLSAVKIEAIRK
jgi:formate dehydrogenase alpha subunit